MKLDGVERAGRWCGIAACAMLIVGCGVFKTPSFLDFSGTKVRWSQVTLAAAGNANRNSAVAVDLVLVTDPAVLEKLVELTSSKWFAARADLAKTYPQTISYRSWELVPGQQISVDGDSFGRPRVAGALVFADYATPGSHRVRIDNFSERLVVRLDIDDFAVSTTPAP